MDTQTCFLNFIIINNGSQPMLSDVKSSVRYVKIITVEATNMRYFQSSEFTFRHQQIDVSMCGILFMDVSNLSNTAVCDTHKVH
jgi:hypothetical protein